MRVGNHGLRTLRLLHSSGFGKLNLFSGMGNLSKKHAYIEKNYIMG